MCSVDQISVILVEDDSFTRASLVPALTSHKIKVVSSTDRAHSALLAVDLHQVDVAILDLDLGPGPTGLDIAHLLRQKNPKIGIIFLTSYSDPRLLGNKPEELPLGSRYLTKSKIANIQELITMIIQVKNSPLVTNFRPESLKSTLTDNQIEILKLIADGLTSSQIAARLQVSEKAVEAAITRLNKVLNIDKLEQKNLRIQLVKAYYELIGKAKSHD